MVLESVGNAIIDEVVNAPVDVATGVITELGKIGNWLQALGVIVIIWIIMQIVNFIFNQKKKKHLKAIEERLEIIEKKIDALNKKSSKKKIKRK